MSFRFRVFSRSKIILLVLLTLLLGGCGQEQIPSEFQFGQLGEAEESRVIVGQVPSRSVIELYEERERFLDKLSGALGRNVELRVAESYAGIIRGMKKERFDVVFLGPLSYVEAVDDTGAPYQPVVRPVRFGKPYYRSIIFTHKNSGISQLEELRGQSIAFVDPNSTSGYLFPRAHIIDNAGFDPFSETSRAEFLGGHDRVVKAVLKGSFTAGVAFDDARSLVLEGNLDEELPILGRSRQIPSEPVAVRSDISPELRKKIEQFFLGLHENYPAVLSTLGDNIDRYETADDDVYDDVRAVVRTLKGVPEPWN